MQIPTFKEALKFWVKLGFISFGGPAGQIAIMHEYLVEKKKWISDSKFLHALNYCMLLPGPEAQQLATYIGWRLHGTWGGLAAGIFFVLPSMFILLGLSIIYVSFGKIPWIYAMFNGLKPAVIAIVILALIKLSKKSLNTTLHFVIALVAFVCIYFLKIQFPVIIFGTIILAVIIQKVFPALLKTVNGKSRLKVVDENEYYINYNSVYPDAGFKPIKLVKQIVVFVVLWILPIASFNLFATDFTFWKQLSVFFTKAAFVTIGGAYAVLPYVAQVSVEKFEWLSKLQMIDGLALGETTPGPLIMVLAFVGFMAGYNHFGFSLALGSLGLLTTTFYTFLPCFFFIFAGGPIIEKSQDNAKLKEVLSLVTAAVVGVVLNLSIYFGMAVIFPFGEVVAEMDFVALAWILISLLAMCRFKIGMITWIAISAVFGLIHFLIAG